jgi:integrase
MRHLKNFSNWLNKAPEDLIKIQKKALQAKINGQDPRESQILETQLKKYLAFMTQQGKRIGTQKLAYASINSFFKLNLFPLNVTIGDRPSGDTEGGSRIPTKTEVIKVVNAAKSQRCRAAILFAKDSGLRVSDIVRMKWGMIKDYGDGFLGFGDVITKKARVKATPFIGPEATIAINQLERKEEQIFPIKAKSLSRNISETFLNAGINDVTAHGLRKYFNVELEAARIPQEYRYRIMGKKTSTYDEKRVYKLFKAYKEAYNHLRIYSEVIDLEAVNQKIENMAKENLRLNAELYKHKQEMFEMQNKIDHLEILASRVLYPGYHKYSREKAKQILKEELH